MLAIRLPRLALGRSGNLLPLCLAAYSTRSHGSSSASTVINIPTSNIYHFGDANIAAPVFCNINWTVKEGEAWAVVGSGSGDKSALFQTLLGQLRISPPPPPPGGLFPFLSVPNPSTDPYTRLAIVSFGHRRSATGGFYDYTARYGAVRDEDRITLRQSMFPQYIKDEMPSPFGKEDRALRQQKEKEQDELPLTEEEKRFFGELVEKMGLEKLLDLPLVALSNGQTRRARIVKAILRKPDLLLLDEPLTGLDAPSRLQLLSLLHSLHTSSSPRVVLGLRTQDAVPEWITHVALVLGGGRVSTGLKQDVLEGAKLLSSNVRSANPGHGRKESESEQENEPGAVLIDMKDVSVRYGPRTVLNNINWQIRQGERWHLQGANGSGKTTLTSLLTGDHPQSYVQSHLHLPSFSPSSQPPHPHRTPQATQHRKRIPTAHLQRLICVVSPELFDAFPRRHPGMSVWEAVGTGFDGGFVPKGKDGVGAVEENVQDPEDQEKVRAWRIGRCWELLEALGPGAWARPGDDMASKTKREIAASFAQRCFSALSVGEQRIVLLMRALVGRPPVVLLDEVWSGMDEGMVLAARKYLRGVGELGEGQAVTHEQAVVLITHWEEEVPWGLEDGVRRFKLEGGVGKVMD